MKSRLLSYPLPALLVNFLLVYLLYSSSRLAFYFTNRSLYAELSPAYLRQLFCAGVIFDTPAILYTNTLFALLFLLPLRWKECEGFYQVVRWLFAVVNTVMLGSNLADSVYYAFSGRRTTIGVFQEFAHEGAGLAGTLLAETFTHWPLVLLVGAYFLVLYFGFRVPQFGRKPHLGVYYPVQILSLAVAAGLAVAGIRGGFTKATRPITLSNANRYANRPADAILVLNTPFTFFRTLGKKTYPVLSYMSDEEMRHTFPVVHYPSTAAQFVPSNVVVFILEGFGKQYSQLMNPELYDEAHPGAMPFLDSLMQVGLSYRYSYANGRKSIDGMPSVLSSIPSFIEPFFLTPASLNEVSSIAGELVRHKGYDAAFWHGAKNSSMGFSAFANASGYKHYYGREDYCTDPNYAGDADFDGAWAIWDEPFLQYFADGISRLKPPFVASIFTASSHHPFRIPAEYEGKLPTADHPMHSCVAYTDNALRLFFERVKDEPWFANTLFVFSADHTNGHTLPRYETDLGLYEIPIVLYAPNMPEIMTGVDSTRFASQVDIMPTVLSLLHYDRPYLAFGQNLLSAPADSTYALQYIPASGLYQIEQGEWLLQSNGEEAMHAYRFKTDSLFRHDALNEMPQTIRQQMHHKLQAVVQQYMQCMNQGRLVYRSEATPPH